MKFVEQDNLKEGLETMFDNLKDYYQRLDEEEVKKILIEVAKSGKDVKKAQEEFKRMKQNGAESPNHSMSSGLSPPGSHKSR